MRTQPKKAPFMRRATWCLVKAAMILMAGYVLLRFGGTYLIAGKFTMPDYRDLAEEGQPIVKAIYEFELQTGLWPRSMNELIPGYLPLAPAGDWEVSWGSLSRHAGMPHTGIIYGFHAKDTGWFSDGEFGRGPIALPRPVSTRPAPAAPERFRNAMAVLDGRIRSNPDNLSLRRDEVAYLVHRERLAEASRALRSAADDFPDEWWPQMALAELAATALPGRSTATFENWVTRHPNFNNYWYLFEYRRQHDQPALALAALEDAAGHAVLRGRDYDAYTPDYFCFAAASYACKRKRAALTLRFCDQWDRIAAERGYGDNGCTALRAAAYLNLGRIPEAQDCARRALVQQRRQAGWSQDLERLNAACQAGTLDFVYDADPDGSRIRPLDLFGHWNRDF